MGVKGKDITIAKNDGVGSYPNLVSFAESPKKAGLYYAGSDDGVVSVSRDDGANWANVTAKIPGLAANTYVSKLTASRFDDATVYATFDGHRLNDFSAYVYASRDYGQTWQSIVGDLPKGEVARTITEDLRNPDVLYLGTERGLYVTFDRGKQWARVKANLPTVPIYEITLHQRDNAMILATHGRGVWILDDLTPFQLFAVARSKDAFLFDVRAASQMNPANDRTREFEGDMQFLGKNPDVGAPFNYFLKAPAKSLSLIVKDSSGKVARELSGDALKGKTDAGVNTALWDLRVEPLPQPRIQQQGPGGGGGGGFGGGGLTGPFVPPGQYQVTLMVDGKEVATNTFSVQGDPEITIAEADRRAAFDAAMELHRMQKTFNEASDSVGALNQRLTAMQQAVKDNKDAPAALKARVEEFAKKFQPVGRQFGVGMSDPSVTGDFESFARALRSRIGQLKSGVMASTSRPTETQSRQIPEVRAAMDKAIQDANQLIGEFSSLQKEMAEGGVYPASVKPIQADGTKPD
jgi:hypothetical protein